MLANAIAFSSFSVDAIAKAKAFYGSTLGLQVNDHPMGLLELSFKTGYRILIYPKENHRPAEYTVLNFEVADIEKTVEALSDKGVEFEHYPDLHTDEKEISKNPGGPKIAWFKDPAGNILSVVETT